MILQHAEYTTNLFLNKYWRFLSLFYYHYFIKKKRFGVFEDYVDKKRKRIAFLIEYVDTKNDQIQFKVVKSLVSTTSILVSNGNILISVLLSLLIYISINRIPISFMYVAVYQLLMRINEYLSYSLGPKRYTFTHVFIYTHPHTLKWRHEYVYLENVAP